MTKEFPPNISLYTQTFLLNKRGRYQEAESMIKAVLAESPEDPEAILCLAELHFARGTEGEVAPLINELKKQAPLKHLLQVGQHANQVCPKNIPLYLHKHRAGVKRHDGNQRRAIRDSLRCQNN